MPLCREVRCLMTFALVGTLVAHAIAQESRPDPKAAERDAATAMLVMRRSPCLGRCDVYQVELYSDGIVVFRGEYNVRRGVRIHELTRDRVDQLVRELLAANVFSIPSYTKRETTCGPSVGLTFRYEGRKAVIRHYHGDTNAPASLTALEDRIEQLVVPESWLEEVEPFPWAWLARHADPDGGWRARAFTSRCDRDEGERCDGPGDVDLDLAVTSLATVLLLFQQVPAHREVVEGGIAFVSRAQQADGRYGDSKSSYAPLTHALATFAMCEAWRLKKSLEVRPRAQAGLDYIATQLPPDGAWRGPVDIEDGDLIVTAWALMALESGRAGGLEINGSARQRAIASIFSKTREIRELALPDSRASDSRPRLIDRAARATAIALWASHCGHDHLARALRTPLAERFREDLAERRSVANAADPTFLFFGSLAASRAELDLTTVWTQDINEKMIESRRSSGCAAGSSDPIGSLGARGGRVWSTAMNCISTTIYYRYPAVLALTK